MFSVLDNKPYYFKKRPKSSIELILETLIELFYIITMICCVIFVIYWLMINV